MVIVTYGGGTNSPAVLIGMIARKEPSPYAILFADTAAEKPHTYQYLEMFSNWIQQFGYPAITVLKRNTSVVGEETLYENCMRRKCLPSVAYGWKTCSQKYKVQPQDRWASRDSKIKSEWKAGRKITKIIGFDFGEPHRARFGETEKYVLRYPLIEWQWDRRKCEEVIQKVGLPLPGKSSCFFCPHSRKEEIIDLANRYPDLYQKAIDLEANAALGLKKVKGLGRRFAWRDVRTGACPVDPHDEIPCGCYD